MRIWLWLAHVLIVAILCALLGSLFFGMAARAGLISIGELVLHADPSNFERLISSAFIGTELVLILAAFCSSILVKLITPSVRPSEGGLGGGLPYLFITATTWSVDKVVVWIIISAIGAMGIVLVNKLRSSISGQRNG